MLTVPPQLEELVAVGRWPLTNRSLQPSVSPERVKRLAPDERGVIYLYSPPFKAMGRRDDPKDFYNWPSSDPGGIDFDLAIEIGDFGIGSDAPIVLDYRVDVTNPCVIRLRYGENSPPLIGKWVVMAPDFASFVEALGL